MSKQTKWNIVEDGETLRTPLFLTDTVRFENHQPHFVRMADAASKSANFSDLATARDAARAARDAWIKQTCEAYKHPPTRDAAQPDTGSPPEELRRHLRDKPDDDSAFGPGDVARLERKRLSQWQEYRDRLSSAWRSPIGRTDPAGATREGSAVERRAAAVEEDRRDFTHEQWRERR